VSCCFVMRDELNHRETNSARMSKHLLTAFLGLQVAAAETPAERAETMLKQMNTTEKLAMLHGHKGLYIGNIVGNDRLGIPSLNMHDGPQGFRVTETTKPEGSTTAW
jgi:hypothetical protein